MRTGLALIVIVLNVIAIVSVLGAPITAGRKLAWCAAVTGLPLAGAIGWLAADRTRQRRARLDIERGQPREQRGGNDR